MFTRDKSQFYQLIIICFYYLIQAGEASAKLRIRNKKGRSEILTGLSQ